MYGQVRSGMPGRGKSRDLTLHLGSFSSTMFVHPLMRVALLRPDAGRETNAL